MTLADGTLLAGEPTRAERYAAVGGAARERLARVARADRRARRLRVAPALPHRQLRPLQRGLPLGPGVRRWPRSRRPAELRFFERVEWGPFVGRVVRADLGGELRRGRDALDEARAARGARPRAGALAGDPPPRAQGDRRGQPRRWRRRGWPSGARRCAPARTAPSTARRRAWRRARGRCAPDRVPGARRTAARRCAPRTQRFRITLADVNGREKELLALGRHALLRRQRARRAGDALRVYLSRWRRVPHRRAARGQYRGRRAAGDLRHRGDDAADGARGGALRHRDRPLPARVRAAGPAGLGRAHLGQQPRGRALDRLRRLRPRLLRLHRSARASTSSSTPSGCRARPSGPAGCCGPRSPWRSSRCRW